MMKQQSEQHTKFPISLPQDKISIVAVTWNLFGSLPPINSLVELVSSSTFKSPPDLIYIGTQECERSLVMSFCCEGKSNWEAMLVQVLPDYWLGATETMRGLHSAVLVRNRLKEYFQVEQRGKLKAGTCNLMGNKGAISIQVFLMGQPFQFINCHLAAHQGESEQRNHTVGRVLNEMIRKDLHTQIIFLGDMNYRIDISKKQYEKMIQGKKNTEQVMKYSEYIVKEQLKNQEDLKRDFLLRFEQGPITFPPTYKIGISNHQYNSERIPGWTDRIFHRKSARMTRLSYGCQYDILGCDHRPVLARYQHSIDERSYTIGSDFIAVKTSSCQLI